MFLTGQVTNDIEALDPGSGCYAAFLTHKGKMLGDLRVLGRSATSCCWTPSAWRCRRLFDMIRRFKIGYELELHKRTVERGLLSLIGPDAARIAARRGTAGRRARQRGGRGRWTSRRSRYAPTPAWTSSAPPPTPMPADRDATRARRDDRSRARQRRSYASSTAGPATGGHRRQHDPPGGGAERARGELHEGLLRRPGDGRASVLQGQAQPPSARAAPVLRAVPGGGRGAAPGRAHGRAPEQRGALPHLRADRPGARAPRGRAGRRA